MKPPIGFVLATHANPSQILYLCEQLTALFDKPPIVIHHDFGQTPLDIGGFPPNVRFVADWLKTCWGGFGIVEGELRALRMLYEESDPDWFVVLSAADYPIQPAQVILDDLYGGGFDAYLDHREIRYCRLPIPPGGWGNENFIAPAWVTLAFERYMAIGFGFYKLATRMKWRKKAFYLRSRHLIERLTPFDGSLRCFAGDHWLTGSRLAAQKLLDDSEDNRRLLAHFRKRPVPDEGIFQSMLCNAAGLNISADNKRYTDWEGCTNHPRTLSETDFPALLASPDHFARKFTLAPETLLKLKELVARKPSRILPASVKAVRG